MARESEDEWRKRSSTWQTDAERAAKLNDELLGRLGASKSLREAVEDAVEFMGDATRAARWTLPTGGNAAVVAPDGHLLFVHAKAMAKHAAVLRLALDGDAIPETPDLDQTPAARLGDILDRLLDRIEAGLPEHATYTITDPVSLDRNLRLASELFTALRLGKAVP